MVHALRNARTVATVGLAASAARAEAMGSSLARVGALAASTAPAGTLTLTAAVAVAGFVMAWHGLPPGVISWDAAADALLAAVRLTGPAAAGIAAWTAIADRRTGLRKLERLAVRSAASRPLGRLGGAAAIAIAGYLVMAAGAAGWMIAHGPVAGPVPAAEVLAGAAAVLCFVSMGFLAGGLVPSTGPPALPALAVAAGAWALTSLSGRAGPGQLRRSGWLRLLAPPDVHHPLFTQWRPGLFGGELVWFAGLGCAAMLAFCWTVGRRRQYLGAAVLPLALAFTGAAWIHAERVRPAVPDAPRLACQSWPLVICVHPALVRALPQLEPAFTTMAAHVAGTPAAIRRLVQYPPGAALPAGPATGGSYAFHLSNLSSGYDRGLESSLAVEVVPPCRGVAGRLNATVRAWLVDTPMPGDVTRYVDGAPIPPTAAIGLSPPATRWPDAVFRAYSEKERRKWLSGHYRRVLSCKVAPADFRPARKRHRH